MLDPHGGLTGPAAGLRRAARRAVVTGLAALLAVPAALVGGAQPASAGFYTYLDATSATVVNSGQPTTALPFTGSALVGSGEDGDGGEPSRVYFTFDLTPYHGKQVISAGAITGEASVNDCDKPRALELWRTDTPVTAPTWRDAPTVREKVADLAPGAPCGASTFETVITPALQQAVTAGWDSVTYLVRVAGDLEQDAQYGRHIKPLGLSLHVNGAPNTPGALSVLGRPCTTDMFVPEAAPYLTAVLTDPDHAPIHTEQLTATFAWWPADRPAERTESTTGKKTSGSVFRHDVPAGLLTDAGTYVFVVRATDPNGAVSAWSPECRFTVDTTSPASPAVSSADYPDENDSYGGPGIPGEFTFGANGSTDTVRYRYSLPGGAFTEVAADGPGGSATVSIAPLRDGSQYLSVRALDRAGNISAVTNHYFRVRTTSPTIVDGNPTAGFGEARTLTFQPRMENVVEYTYRLNDGPEQTVASAADGTATVTIVPAKAGWNDVYVRSRTADNLPSGEANHRFHLATKPTVSSVEYPINTPLTGAPAGTPGTFVFQPGMPGVTEYVYSIAFGPTQTVAAGPDGSASMSYTPSTSKIYRITVYSRTADGAVSETFTGTFYASKPS
ncbi:hypothetical protein [Micromonospora sp. NBRC 101691]|uniref:hypothetical protein n=1 Tax=Micromonospora sp. NBRC 101691 TaxID=3032198 RepID=UPI0024A2170C|nr:hypothetical protein [Micromonospora sp. NBRC 101691]GLY26523.1 hypothetical protein Misp04_62540 [Micromonospora sp. NBRC 101691]